MKKIFVFLALLMIATVASAEETRFVSVVSIGCYGNTQRKLADANKEHNLALKQVRSKESVVSIEMRMMGTTTSDTRECAVILLTYEAPK